MEPQLPEGPVGALSLGISDAKKLVALGRFLEAIQEEDLIYQLGLVVELVSFRGLGGVISDFLLQFCTSRR